MRIISTLQELNEIVLINKEKHLTTGFVPTMGALHLGHLSLVEKSKFDNNITMVSIFVNPTQFNDKNDFDKYPRTIEQDITFLKPYDPDILFIPSEKEMYPAPDTNLFEFGNLDKVMEGKHRAGHFNGVAQIVLKLFTATRPDRAYFGVKDFQQIVIIKQLVKNLNLKIDIVPCPIVREKDGLAMSSRNRLLSPDQRKSAVLISSTLFKSRDLISKMDIVQLKEWVINSINFDPALSVEYFDIVDDTSLIPIESWHDKSGKIGCIAVKIGSVRLIDNIRYNS